MKRPAHRGPRRRAAAALLGLLLPVAPAGCGPLGKGGAVLSTAPATPPDLVYDRFERLGHATFEGVPLGRARLSAFGPLVGLERYDRQPAHWGPPDNSFRVEVVTSARSEGTTALLLEGGGDDPVVASVLVRDFGGAPPPQTRFEDFVPWLSERFPPPYEVFDVPAPAGSAPLRDPRQDRYAFPRPGGVKLGFLRRSDATWVLDNVEYFSPDWSPQALARLKKLPALHKVGVLRPGGRLREPRPAAAPGEPAGPASEAH